MQIGVHDISIAMTRFNAHLLQHIILINIQLMVLKYIQTKDKVFLIFRHCHCISLSSFGFFLHFLNNLCT